jgi:hypothetical protein
VDDLLGQCEAAWREIAQRLEGLRRQIEVAGAQMQRRRSLAARRKPGDEPPSEDPARSAATQADEASSQSLVHGYEDALRESEVRRATLRAEMAALRRRREAALRSIPSPLARAYESLIENGCRPAVAAVTSGVCSACGSAVAASAGAGPQRGWVAACPTCERLLQPSLPPQPGQ